MITRSVKERADRVVAWVRSQEKKAHQRPVGERYHGRTVARIARALARHGDRRGQVAHAVRVAVADGRLRHFGVSDHGAGTVATPEGARAEEARRKAYAVELRLGRLEAGDLTAQLQRKVRAIVRQELRAVLESAVQGVMP